MMRHVPACALVPSVSNCCVAWSCCLLWRLSWTLSLQLPWCLQPPTARNHHHHPLTAPTTPTPHPPQISARQQAVSILKVESEKERLSVTLQPLPREPPALPEPKVLVTPAAPFVPALPVVAA